MPKRDEQGRPLDIVDEARESEAIEAARQRAIAAPSRPRRAPKTEAETSYARAALQREREAVAKAVKGERESTVNAALLSLGHHIAAGKLDEQEVRREIESACYYNKFIQDDYGGSAERFWNRKGNRSLRQGMQQPRDYSRVGTQTAPEPNVVEVDDISGGKRRRRKVSRDETDEADDERQVEVKFLSSMKSHVPIWIWRIPDGSGDIGMMQLHNLVLFAGRPGAGKSTAARWIAALISNGELPGAWHGTPLNVALFCAEEDNETAVMTSLDAAGADRSRVAVTFVKDLDVAEGHIHILRDEQKLVKELLDKEIRCLIVDPVMSTFSHGSDPNSQLDVRRHLAAYNRIAKRINGIVIGVAHLKKPQSSNGRRVGSILDEITGSSAWGEVVRHAIAFASMQTSGEHMRLMQIAKNSAGPDGIAWEYRLTTEQVQTDDGIDYETIRFDMRGRSLVTIDEMGSGEDDSDLFPVHVQWLREYLEANGPRPSAEIKKDARSEMSVSQLHRARRKLKLDVKSRSTADTPYTTWWGLPGAYWT